MIRHVSLLTSDPLDTTTNYTFDCKSSNNSVALVSAFPAGTIVRNLFFPYETVQLEESVITLNIENSTGVNGCLPSLQMSPWGYKAFVPEEKFVFPRPTITKFEPGHDARILSQSISAETLPFEIHFSRPMDCDSVKSSIRISSTTENNQTAELDSTSITCSPIDAEQDIPGLVAQVGTAWVFSARLANVFNGIHSISVNNATTEDGSGSLSTNANDTFLVRVGSVQNPVVFPGLANYTTDLLFKNDSSGSLWVSHKAAGADLWRYSLNWGSSWSDWAQYEGGNDTLAPQAWSGTEAQKWQGDHVMLQ